MAATVRRWLVNMLDRPGGRAILGSVATWHARRKTGLDLEIFYDGVWLHRIGRQYVADSLRFEHYVETIREWEAQATGSVEDAADFWFHVYRPQAGDVIVDAGAGYGSDSQVFSRTVGETGKVLAIEAHPSTYQLLEKHCHWNRLSNVVPCQLAVMDKHCSVYMDDRPGNPSNAVRSGSHDVVPVRAVPGESLDEICRLHGLEKIDLLKMNIEGAERLAIRGMEQVIARTRYVCIACHDFRADAGEPAELFRTKSMVLEFLKDQGFDIALREDDPRCYVRDHVHGTNRALKA